MNEFYLLKYNDKYVGEPYSTYEFGLGNIVMEFYNFKSFSLTDLSNTHKYPTKEMACNAIDDLVSQFSLDRDKFKLEHYGLKEIIDVSKINNKL